MLIRPSWWLSHLGPKQHDQVTWDHNPILLAQQKARNMNETTIEVVLGYSAHMRSWISCSFWGDEKIKKMGLSKNRRPKIQWFIIVLPFNLPIFLGLYMFVLPIFRQTHVFITPSTSFHSYTRWVSRTFPCSFAAAAVLWGPKKLRSACGCPVVNTLEDEPPTEIVVT